MTHQILNKILTIGKGTPYICLENTVGQKWYFPFRRMRAYMSLFQPSSLRGNIVALVLPYLKFFTFLLHYINASAVRLQFDDVFVGIVENTFGKKDISFSIFCGSPGKHQKPTIMILSGKQYLGYCKITDNPEIIHLFREEQRSLDFLKSNGVEHIPSIIFCAPLLKSQNVWIQLQTTERKHKVELVAFSDIRVIEFVRQMMANTKVLIEYEDSDFSKAKDNLKHLLSLLNKGWIPFIREKIEEVERRLKSKSHPYSAYHGDFTPWNSFAVEDHLFVFDFEYFKKTYPLYADFFHYFTQDQIYDKYADAKQIVDEYYQLKQTILCDVPNCDFLYMCYILGIMEFYLNRDRGFLNNRMESIFCIWNEILIRISNGKDLE